MNTEQKQALIDEVVIQALRDDVRQWQQRAEAAEQTNEEYALLADSWEAHARRATAEQDELQAKLKEQDELIHSLQETVYRYSGPAPAVNLAELVPDDENGSPQGFVAWYERYFALHPYKGSIHVSDCEEAWRASILYHIEKVTNGQTIPAAKVGSMADTEVQAGSEGASDEGKSK